MLSKHKALFTLIPQRVSQILKMVRLHAHATPAQRLEIVHGAYKHVDGKRHVVIQLRDTISSVGAQLSSHLRESIQKRFTTLETRLTSYIGTLNTTYKVLDDEQSKLIIAAGASPEKYKTGKAYQAAQAVLAPNHIDTLVDTLAGHDRAATPYESAQVGALAAQVKQLRKDVAHQQKVTAPVVVVETSQDHALAAHVTQLQQEVAAINERAGEDSAVLIQKDFEQAMADMSHMHTQALADQNKEHKKHVPKLKKNIKKEQNIDKREKTDAASGLGKEVSDDLQYVGRLILRLYRNIKNGLGIAISQVYRLARTGVSSLRDRVIKSARAEQQPVMISGIALGGQLASSSAWTGAGKLGTASLFDTARVAEQPLLPVTIKESYDHACAASAQRLSDMWQCARTAGHACTHKMGSLLGGVRNAIADTAQTGAQVIGATTSAVGSLASGATRSARNTVYYGVKKAAHAGVSALESTRLAACRIGARTCAIGAVTYRGAAGAAQHAGSIVSRGTQTLWETMSIVGSHIRPSVLATRIYTGVVAVASVCKKVLDAAATVSHQAMQIITNIFEGAIGWAGSACVSVWNGIGYLADILRMITTQWYHSSIRAMAELKSRIKPQELFKKGFDTAHHGVMCVRNIAGQCVAVIAQSAGTAAQSVGANVVGVGSAIHQGAYRVAHVAQHGVAQAKDGLLRAGQQVKRGVRATANTLQAGVVYGKGALGTAAGHAGRSVASVAQRARNGLSTAVGTLQNGFKHGVDVVAASTSSALQSAHQGARRVAHATHDGVARAQQGLLRAGQQVKRGVRATANTLQAGVVYGKGALGTAAGHAGRSVASVAQRARNGLSTAVGTLQNGFKHGVDVVAASTSSALQSAHQGARRVAHATHDGVARAQQSLLQAGQQLTRGVRATANTVQAGVVYGKGALGTAAGHAGRSVASVAQRARNGLSTAVGTLQNGFKHGVDVVAASTSSALQSAHQGARRVAHATHDGVARAQQSLLQAGQQLTRGVRATANTVQAGVVYGKGALGTAAGHAGRSVASVAQRARNGLSTAVGTLQNGFKHGAAVIGHGAGSAVRSARSATQQVTQVTFTLGDAMMQYWYAFMGVVRNTVDAVFRAAQWLKKILFQGGSTITHNFVGTARSVGARISQAGADTLDTTRSVARNSMHATGVAVGASLDTTRHGFRIVGNTLHTGLVRSKDALGAGAKNTYKGATHAAQTLRAAAHNGAQRLYAGASGIVRHAGNVGRGGVAHLSHGAQVTLHSAQQTAHVAAEQVGKAANIARTAITGVANRFRSSLNTLYNGTSHAAQHAGTAICTGAECAYTRTAGALNHVESIARKGAARTTSGLHSVWQKAHTFACQVESIGRESVAQAIVVVQNSIHAMRTGLNGVLQKSLQGVTKAIEPLYQQQCA